MPENKLNFEMKFEAIHPLTEDVLALLKDKGPLAHDDFIAIASDIKTYANTKIHNHIVIEGG